MGDWIGSIRWWDVVMGLLLFFSICCGVVCCIKFVFVRIGDFIRGCIVVFFNDYSFVVYDFVSIK